MKFKALIFTAIIFLFIVSFVGADYVTMPSFGAYWWNDTIPVSGVAKYTNGTAISGASVVINLGSNQCTNTTASDGSYFCSINAPLNVGTYNLTINVTNSTGSSTINSTSILVQPTYGLAPIGTTPRIVYEIPMLMQEPSGKVNIVIVRITAWRSA